MKKILYLLFLIPYFLFGQNDRFDHKDFIFNLVQYRNELIADNFENYKNLVQLDSLWKQTDEGKKERSAGLISNILYLHQAWGTKPSKIIKLINKKKPEFADPYVLTEEKIDILIQNRHLTDLLMDGILKPDPPFQIAPNTWIFEELENYDIKNGMSVAEIVAGNGAFSLMLALAYDSLDIYINELDYFLIEYAKEKITRCKSSYPNNSSHFIHGKKNTTKLDTLKIDKIIIRNSFHHFSKKEDMLSSIKNAMTPGSDLYIYDPILDTNKDFGCDEVMKKKELEDMIHANGLRIVNKKKNEDWGWMLFHCKI